MMNDREQLRETFNQSADVYDRIRPAYPDALVDDVISLSEIPKQGQILEIGCGTGKATEPFVVRGYSMDCLEIGKDLAAVATAKFSERDNVRIIVSSFEDWELNEDQYDLVFAATSFHWVDPAVAYVKSASLLRPNGALAVFSNMHVRKTEGFFAGVQGIYRTSAPSMAHGPSKSKKAREARKVPIGRELFQDPVIHRYPHAIEYSADQYIELLGTYSDHISLPRPERKALFDGIANLINTDYGGKVLKHYEAVLTFRRLRE
ncbi:MAG: class I SAM-dependent methyltransferase [Pseudomonadales bacterium]